jgi:hypothetical protein
MSSTFRKSTENNCNKYPPRALRKYLRNLSLIDANLIKWYTFALEGIEHGIS